MIKTAKGETNFKGTYEDIMSDYCTITYGLAEFLNEEVGLTEEEAKKEVLDCIELAFKTEEEMEDMIKDLIAKRMSEFLDDLKGDKKDE